MNWLWTRANRKSNVADITFPQEEVSFPNLSGSYRVTGISGYSTSTIPKQGNLGQPMNLTRFSTIKRITRQIGNVQKFKLVCTWRGNVIIFNCKLFSVCIVFVLSQCCLLSRQRRIGTRHPCAARLSPFPYQPRIPSWFYHFWQFTDDIPEKYYFIKCLQIAVALLCIY